jgi:hypothetical protein
LGKIVLPKPNEIIKANLINPRVLCAYSEPKTGKTSLFALLKNSLLLDLEDGSGFIDATKIKVESLEHLNDIGGEILKAGKPYDYIILDTATQLEVWCEEDATEMYRHSILGKNWEGDSVLELPKGAGYYWLRKSYGTYFKALTTLAPTLIVLAHVRDKMLVDKKGNNVEATDLDLTGKLKQITCAKADAIGYMYRKTIGAEEGKRIQEVRMSFRSAGITTGSRARHLEGNDVLISTVVGEDETIVANWDVVFKPKA